MPWEMRCRWWAAGRQQGKCHMHLLCPFALPLWSCHTIRCRILGWTGPSSQPLQLFSCLYVMGLQAFQKSRKKMASCPSTMWVLFSSSKKQIKSKMFTRSDRNFARKQLLECIRFQGLLVKQCIELNVMLDILWSAKYCMCLETLSLLIFYDNTHKHWQLLGVLESFCLSALKKRKRIVNSWNDRNILFQGGNFRSFHRFQENLEKVTENGIYIFLLNLGFWDWYHTSISYQKA